MTKEDALFFLERFRTKGINEKLYDALGVAIEALNAQTEKHTEERTETHTCDLISKAMVCEILADIYPTDGEKVVAVKKVDKAYEAIQQLPSAKPSLQPTCNQVATDCISRQAAYDALMAEPLKWDDSSVWESARCHQWMMDIGVIKALPSAQPERKKGEWINDGDCYVCSECRSVYGWWADSQVSNYCPHCGARMKR